MANEFNSNQTTNIAVPATPQMPELVFGEPDPTPVEAIVIQENPEIAESTDLSPEEQQMAAEFAKQIDLRNSNAILQYGVGTQKKIADFSEGALQNVRTKDLGEIGQALNTLVHDLKFTDAEEKKGFLGLFKKAGSKIETMKARYQKAEIQVERVSEALEQHQIQLMKDIAILDKMYDTNLMYFKELSMYIAAGKMKLKEARETELVALMQKAQQSGLPQDAQAAKDFDALCVRFEKKLHDLELTRTISIQTAPQIRLVQNSNTMMVEKIQSTIVNTIPLWKSQMVLALGVEHANQAAAAQRQVTDMTNELLRKNADTLRMASVQTSQESERGIVDMETLQHTNQQLIATLDEVMQIQADGRAKRAQAEAELQRMENELKAKLLEIR